MTRTQVFADLAFIQFTALPNNQKVAQMKKWAGVGAGESRWPNWLVVNFDISNTAVAGTAPAAGDIMVNALEETAPGGDGITDRIYYLTFSAPGPMIATAKKAAAKGKGN